MEFSEKLLQLRRARGLSQEQLAEELGVSRQAVSKWETGEALPETDKLVRLGDCFAVTLDSLLRPDCALCARTPAGAGEHPAQDADAAPSAQNMDAVAQDGLAGALPPGTVRTVCWALLVLGSCLLVAVGNDGSMLWYWPLLRMLPGFVLQLLAVTGFEVDVQRQPAAARPAQRLLFWAPALPLAALLPLWLLGCLAMRLTRSESFGFLVLIAGMALALVGGVRCLYRWLLDTGRVRPSDW